MRMGSKNEYLKTMGLLQIEKELKTTETKNQSL